MKLTYQRTFLALLTLPLIVGIAIVSFPSLLGTQQAQQAQQAQQDRKKHKDSTKIKPKRLAGEERNQAKKMRRQNKKRRYSHPNSRNLIQRAPSDLYGRVSETRISENLPVKKSDLIVIGKIKNSQPYFSENKGAIFTEFTISVENTIKSSGGIGNGTTIVAEREGGAITMPNGRVIKYLLLGSEALPEDGMRYVLFLSANNDGDFTIIQAYEIGANGILALSKYGEEHTGKSESNFINEIVSKK